MPRLSPRRRRFLAVVLTVLAGLPALTAGLFVINGVWLAAGETPIVSPSIHSKPVAYEPVDVESAQDSTTLRIMAFNIAKAFAIDEDLNTRSTEAVREQLQQVADVINAEQPDFVFLQEVVLECGPSPVNQVAVLSRLTDMPNWVFGENFNFGLPFYRMVSGNVILSRHPIEAIDNPSLPGRRPFYTIKNNRRLLLCQTRIAGQDVTLASIHNCIIHDEINLEQVHVILDRTSHGPAILAGDFNAKPGSPSIDAVVDSERFVSDEVFAPTFPSDGPSRCIDYIFGPRDWTVLQHRVICTEASDHCAVLTEFRIPTPGAAAAVHVNLDEEDVGGGVRP